jgi:hypothetical protein
VLKSGETGVKIVRNGGQNTLISLYIKEKMREIWSKPALVV